MDAGESAVLPPAGVELQLSGTVALFTAFLVLSLARLHRRQALHVDIVGTPVGPGLMDHGLVCQAVVRG